MNRRLIALQAVAMIVVGQLVAFGAGVYAFDGEVGGGEATAAPAAVAGRVQVDLRDMFRDQFGGMWMDGAGNLTVATVGQATEMRTAALAGLSDAPSFVAVSRSEAELERLHEEIVRLADVEFRIDGVQLVSVETDIKANKVAVSVLNGKPDQVSALQARLGPGTVVSTVSEPIMGRTCSISDCPNPLKGGLKVYRGGAFKCLSGFVWYSTQPKYYLSTAGHCAGTSGGGEWCCTGATWEHPAFFTRGYMKYGGWYNGSYADVALIDINANQKSNQICMGATLCALKNITSEQGEGQDVVGAWVFAQTQGGTRSGQIEATSVSINICIDNGAICRLHHDQRRAGFTTVLGDSGGPVYSLNMAIGTIASGLGSDTFYSHVGNIHIQAGVLIRLTP